MQISIAQKEDIEGIRKIWEEQFTSDKEYLEVMFNRIIPLCTSYIYKEAAEVLSVASFMPMKFIDSSIGLEYEGWYMFGVATLNKAKGRRLAAKIIIQASEEIETKNYHFIFERPANQSLNKYYLKLGFTKSLNRIPHRFPTQFKSCSSGNNTTASPQETLAEGILEEIRENYARRMEWQNLRLLENLIKLGELEWNNNNLSSKEDETTYIAIKTLNGIAPQTFNGCFFCFPME